MLSACTTDEKGLFGSAIVIHEAATPFFRFFQTSLLIQRLFLLSRRGRGRTLGDSCGTGSIMVSCAVLWLQNRLGGSVRTHKVSTTGNGWWTEENLEQNSKNQKKTNRLIGRLIITHSFDDRLSGDCYVLLGGVDVSTWFWRSLMRALLEYKPHAEPTRAILHRHFEGC